MVIRSACISDQFPVSTVVAAGYFATMRIGLPLEPELAGFHATANRFSPPGLWREYTPGIKPTIPPAVTVVSAVARSIAFASLEPFPLPTSAGAA